MAYLSVLLYVAVLFLRPQEWIPLIYGWPIVNYVAIIALAATLVRLSRRDVKLRAAPQNLLMGLFFAAMLLSNLRQLRYYGWEPVSDTLDMMGKVVILYLLVVINIDSVKRLKGLIAVLIVGALFMTLHGIRQYHTGFGFGGQAPQVDWRTDGVRVIGFGIFNDPNDMALILVTVLPFIINAIHRRNVAPPVRILSLGCALAVCYCIFRTNSRGGWLALALMLVVYMMLHMRRKKLAIIAGGCLVAGILALGPSHMGLLSTEEGSAHGRITAWAQANAMFKRHLIVGVGRGMFSEFSERGLVAHNSFVHCYAETGLLGYFLWLALLCACLKDGYALSRLPAKPQAPPSSRPPETVPVDLAELSRIGRVALVALIGYLGAAMFLSRTYTPPLYVFIGIFAAMRMMHETQAGPLPNGFVYRNLKQVFWIEILSIAGLYVMIRVLQ